MSRSGVIRCLLAAVLFGATAPAASELAGTVPAFTLAGMLYVGAALAVAPSVARRPPSLRAMVADWRPTSIAVVFGGAIGPVLLMAGLARTSAATASILLNTELVATVVLAAVLFREHLGAKVIMSAGVVTVAGALLAWSPGAGLDRGALFVVAACACWGLDNGITARIEHLAPEHVVLAKGLVAGAANLLIGWLSGASNHGFGDGTGVGEVLAALGIGAFGYGASIVLWVRGARELGAARAQVIFATAPFVGVALAWLAFGDDVVARQVVAVAVAAVGVGLSLRSDHEHAHHHHALEHDHEHEHGDGHHDHEHADGFTGRHAHPHAHGEMVHAHPHVPDLHHRHDH